MPGQGAARELMHARQSIELRPAEAARVLEVHRSTYQHWEQGDRVPPPTAAARLRATTPPADQVTAAVRSEPGCTRGELEAKLRELEPLCLSGARLRALGALLAERGVVLRRVQRTDLKGRKYVAYGVYAMRSRARPGAIDEQAPRISGAQLARARRFTGMTGDELAERTALKASSIRRLEAGGALVPVGHAEELINALDLPRLLQSDEIRRQRREAGWSGDQLAARLGVSGGLVRQWERGLPIPRHHMLRLAATLDEAGRTSSAQLQAGKAELVKRLVEEAAAHPGIGRASLLHRYRVVTLTGSGRPGPRLDAEEALAEAIRSGRLVERETTRDLPSRAKHRTIVGLFTPDAAPDEEDPPALTGNELRSLRARARATRRELAAAIGTSIGSVAQMERRGDRPVSRRWRGPLHSALEALRKEADARPEQETQILDYLAAHPGSTRSGVQAGLGQTVRRGVQALIDDGRVVEAPVRDSLGRQQVGLYSKDDHEAPAEVRQADGPALRRLRSATGWSSTELASELGVSPRRLLRWETGERECSPEWAARFQQALNMPPPKLGGTVRRLIDGRSDAPVELRRSRFNDPDGPPIKQAIADGLVHVEERLVPGVNSWRRRRFLVKGSGDDEERTDARRALAKALPSAGGSRSFDPDEARRRAGEAV